MNSTRFVPGPLQARFLCAQDVVRTAQCCRDWRCALEGVFTTIGVTPEFCSASQRFWCTVQTGLEDIAAQEAREALHTAVDAHQGSISFAVPTTLPLHQLVQTLRTLRMVEYAHVFVVRRIVPLGAKDGGAPVPGENMTAGNGGTGECSHVKTAATALRNVRAAAASASPLQLARSLACWRAFQAQDLRDAPVLEGVQPAQAGCHGGPVRFKAVAKRGGRHPRGFSSDAVKLSAARGIEASTPLVGGVRLGHDVVIVVQVHHNSMWLGIKLHGDPLSLRVDGDAVPTRSTSMQGERLGDGANAAAARDGRALSSTTLRPALALALLRMASNAHDLAGSRQPAGASRDDTGADVTQRGAAGILLDPMCGCGTICAQAQCRAAGARSNSMFSIAADIDGHAVALAAHNLRARPRCDVLQCDARRLPLRSGCIDAIVTDMPFGKRMGDGSMNRELYPAVVREVARCLSDAGGVAVMLSASRRGAILRNACKAVPGLRWVRGNMLQMGGLQALAAAVAKKPDADENLSSG